MRNNLLIAIYHFLSSFRVVMSVNDKWHYCHNSEVLVGSRAMRDRHLLLLGYVILQVSPYHLKNHIF